MRGDFIISECAYTKFQFNFGTIIVHSKRRSHQRTASVRKRLRDKSPERNNKYADKSRMGTIPCFHMMNVNISLILCMYVNVVVDFFFLITVLTMV